MQNIRKLVNFRTPAPLDDALAKSAANRGITKTALLNHLIYDFCNRETLKRDQFLDRQPSSPTRAPRPAPAAHRDPLEYDPFNL
jgi:hypothetical protein